MAGKIGRPRLSATGTLGSVVVYLLPEQMRWLREKAAGTPVSVVLRGLVAEAMKRQTDFD